MTGKVWKWLSRHDLGLLTLKIAGAGAEPALRVLCEALPAKLNQTPTFTHVDKAGVLAALGIILGIPEQNLVWLYLNKGAHEEVNREDFDAGVVERIVAALEAWNLLGLGAA